MSWFSSMYGVSEPGVSRGGSRGIAANRIAQARGSHYVRSVAVLAGGTAAGQGVVLVASPVLTRIYTPADFGVLAVFTAVLSIVVMIAALRFEVGIPLAVDNTSAANVLLLSLLVVTGVSAVVGIGAWLAGDVLARWIDMTMLRPYLWLLPIGVLCGGMYRVFEAWATREEAFGPLARTKLNRGVCMVVAQIGIGLAKAGPIGLLLGWTAGQASGIGTLSILAWRRDGAAVRGVSITGMRAAFGRYRQLAMMSSGSQLMNSVVAAFPVMFLGSVYGLGVAGAFALGQRVVTAPMEMVAGSMAQVYFGEAYRLKREDPGRLYGLFVKTVGRLALIGVVPILIVALTSPWTFSLAFGSDWREAGSYLQVLAPMLVIHFIYNGFGGTLEVLERKDLIMIASVARVVCMGGAALAAQAFNASALGAVALLGAAALLGYLSYGVLCWRALAQGRIGTPPASVGGA